MFAARVPPSRIRPTGFNRGRLPVDIAWKETWPFLVSNIIASLMIVCTIIIIALEIASLAISTSSFYGNTASTGAGIWCGVAFLFAAVALIILNFVRNLRSWTTTVLIATVIAACFAIILLGLDAKAVDDGRVDNTIPFNKTKILAAQLAFAIFELLLCLPIIIIYVIALTSVARLLHQQRRIVR